MMMKSGWFIGSVFALIVGTGAAQAVTVPLQIGPNTLLSPGFSGDTGEVKLGAGVVIAADYLFTISQPLMTIAVDLVTQPVPGGVPGVPAIGIKNAQLNWFDVTAGNLLLATLQVTDPTTGNQLFIQPTLFTPLSLLDQYMLVVSGTTLAGGGNYDLTLQVPNLDTQQTPLPGALVLFGTVLAGAGAFMRRRRDKGLAVAV